MDPIERAPFPRATGSGRIAGMDPAELELRRAIVTAFAETGSPPAVGDGPALRGLVERRVVVLSDDGEVLMEGAPHEVVAHEDVRRVYLGERFSL